jgi:osmotically-inducible protein OsmY
METLTMTLIMDVEHRTLSERRVVRRVADALRRSGQADLSGLRVDARAGQVYLSGSVRSWHAKQLAQELAMHVPGVRRVHNRTFVT